MVCAICLTPILVGATPELGQNERRAATQTKPVVSREVLIQESERGLGKNEVLRKVSRGGKTEFGVGVSILTLGSNGYLRELSATYKSYRKLDATRMSQLLRRIATWNAKDLNRLPLAEIHPSAYDASDVTLYWRNGTRTEKWEAFRFKYDHETSPLGQMDDLKLWQ
jgi:hypothetical protein